MVRMNPPRFEKFSWRVYVEFSISKKFFNEHFDVKVRIAMFFRIRLGAPGAGVEAGAGGSAPAASFPPDINFAFFVPNIYQTISFDLLIPKMKEQITELGFDLETWQKVHLLASQPRAVETQDLYYWTPSLQRSILSSNETIVQNEISILLSLLAQETDLSRYYAYVMRFRFLNLWYKNHLLKSGKSENNSEYENILSNIRQAEVNEQKAQSSLSDLLETGVNYDKFAQNLSTMFKDMYYGYNTFSRREKEDTKFNVSEEQRTGAKSVMNNFLRMFQQKTGIMLRTQTHFSESKETFPFLPYEHTVRGGLLGQLQELHHEDELVAGNRMANQIANNKDPKSAFLFHVDKVQEEFKFVTILLYLDAGWTTEFLKNDDTDAETKCKVLLAAREANPDGFLRYQKPLKELDAHLNASVKRLAKQGSMIIFPPSRCHRRPLPKMASEARLTFVGVITDASKFKEFFELSRSENLMQNLLDSGAAETPSPMDGRTLQKRSRP